MKNIYVGNLTFDATEDQVRGLFEAYGPVDKVSIVTDRDTGQPRGFAFVEMTDDESAGKAMEALQRHQSRRPQFDRERGASEDRPASRRWREGSGGFRWRRWSRRRWWWPWALGRRWWWRGLGTLTVNSPAF